VRAWFKSLDASFTEVGTAYGYVLHFTEMGSLAYLPDGQIDADASPVVTIVLPQVRRGVLWTIGEVHFRASPLRKRFPVLYKIDTSFSKWLSSLDCIFSNKRKENPFSYYLQGSTQNDDAPIFAFPSGLEEIQKERYFVSYMDDQSRLETLCKTLRLRGVNCAAA